jgi:hypothetical protein
VSHGGARASVDRPELAPFAADAILTEAARRTGGLDDLGDGPYGIDPAVVRRDFAPYIEQYGLSPE